MSYLKPNYVGNNRENKKFCMVIGAICRNLFMMMKIPHELIVNVQTTLWTFQIVKT